MAALRLLAAACRPLNLQELAWAVALSTAPDQLGTIAALSDLVNLPEVRNLIQFFVAPFDLDNLGHRQIQLAHQSVSDTFLATAPKLGNAIASESGIPVLTHRHVERLEAYMLDICGQYLLLDEVGSTALFSDEQLATEKLPQM